MDKKKFLSSGLLEQYVLGLTSPEENRIVERYAESFPEIRQEIDAMRKAMDQYALKYSIKPPRQTEPRIMDDIDKLEAKLGGRQKKDAGILTPVQNRPLNWNTLTAFILVAVLGFTTLLFYKEQTNTLDRYERLSAEFHAFKQECETAGSQTREFEKIYAFLRHKHTMPVTLLGAGPAPDTEVIVYWNKEHKEAYLNIINLPAPPPGKQYQIWADVEGEMIDMGIFETDPSRLHAVRFIEHAESLNITLEPRGGSVHPTVELLFARGRL
jgi:anti-sigma-K factor RskA